MICKSKQSEVKNVSRETEDESKEDDYVTKSIGAFGLWQLIFILIGSSTRFISTWSTMGIVFLAPETNFVCKIFSVNTTVNVTNNTCYDNCVKYEYTNEIFEETMISEFGLVCKNEWLQSFAQTILMLGMLAGVAFFGWFSDSFGRRKAMILSGIINAISMMATSFCPDFWSVAAARFFNGTGSGGYLTLISVYLSELVGRRMIGLVLCSFIFTFEGAGLSIQAFFAYYTSTWRNYLIVCSIATMFLVCLTFFLPETPRWLIVKGKRKEAIELMTRAAKFNKLDTSNISENITKVTEQLCLDEKKVIKLTYFDLFRTKKLAIWTVTSISLWFVTGFTFFGLLQYIATFVSNSYIVVFVLGIAQILAAPLSVAIVKFCSRKVSSICTYFTVGVFSLALAFVSNGSVTAAILGSIGSTASAISFCLIYIIVIELYPTNVRNMGFSASSVGSKVAAVLAPFVVNMKTQWAALLIFSALGFLGIIFCLILPETKGKNLKDSIAEVQ